MSTQGKCSHIFENGVCIKCEHSILLPDDKPDMINHPPHYIGKSGLQAIEVVEDFELNHRLASAVEYILRHAKKGDPLNDLKKARWHLNREIEKIEK